jgi:DNA-binding NarL/FixJ family response regulator
MQNASLTGRSILLIEDEPLIALDIQEALQNEGALVRIANSLASTARHLECYDLSAAIVDFALPDGTAGDVCAALRSRGIPFILHTGYPHCSEVCGAAAIVPKPAPPGALVIALRDALPIGTEIPPSRLPAQTGLSR